VSGKSRLNALAIRAALENIPSAALIVGDSGLVAEANARGRALLDRSGKWARRTLVDVERAQDFFELTPLHQPGRLVHYLAVLRAGTIQLDRVAVATLHWRLSPREADVLSQLVEGQKNKSIAKKVGCAERTVEQHVRKILWRARAKNRSALVAKFWTSM
jgi:DNA-binding CsgD family transcriptional regulator